MRAYDFSTHNKTVKRDKSRFFTYAFVALLVVAFGAFIYYVVLNSPRILFYFRENKYSEIERAHADALSAIQNLQGENTAQRALQTNEAVEFLDLVHKLQKDHGEDPILFFHEATLLNEAVHRQMAQNQQVIAALLFRDFIQRAAFPIEIDHELWQKALLTGRRARALGLPDVLAQKLLEAELETYFLGGRPWWESAHSMVATAVAARKLPVWHLIAAGLARETPDFELIKAAYGVTIATFAKGNYYMRSGNSPLGISNFKELSKSTTDASARDRALYILGYLSGRDKRSREQLSFYKQIRFPEFAPHNPYFVNEYHYLLRFHGQKSEADQLMRAWEEMRGESAEK